MKRRVIADCVLENCAWLESSKLPEGSSELMRPWSSASCVSPVAQPSYSVTVSTLTSVWNVENEIVASPAGHSTAQVHSIVES